MKENTMILGQDQYYSLNCYETKVNNKVLVVGTSGSRKNKKYCNPQFIAGIGKLYSFGSERQSL